MYYLPNRGNALNGPECLGKSDSLVFVHTIAKVHNIQMFRMLSVACISECNDDSG